MARRREQWWAAAAAAIGVAALLLQAAPGAALTERVAVHQVRWLATPGDEPRDTWTQERPFLTATAEGLKPQESLSVGPDMTALLGRPEPGGGGDLGGMRTQGTGADHNGWGPGQHVAPLWATIPTGTQVITVHFGAGVPAQPAPGTGPGEGPGEAAPRVRGSTAALRVPMGPTEPGTERFLGTIDLDLGQLGVPREVWDAAG